MKMTQLFTKISKTAPGDEASKNARLLIQAGYVHKEMAGVYSFLPLGLRVLNNITRVIREEMDAIGGQEVLMPALQIKERYEATGRWDDKVVDDWFKTRLANGTELGLGFSHEENLSPIMKQYLFSYKELPVAPYQIQWKFRNELRSKSGLMRGREFLMKDMYSFATSQEQHVEFYTRIQEAYHRIYDRLGIGDRTVVALASGGSFSKYSHEFQTFSEVGEDTIFQTGDGVYHNREIAPSKISRANRQETPLDYQEVEGKGIIGVKALLEHLRIPIERSTKTLFYTTDSGEIVVAALRSDYEVNTIKLAEIVECKQFAFTTDRDVKKLTGAELGYAGFVNLPKSIRLFLDDSLEGLCNFETGANKTGYHAINVNFGRDVAMPEKFYDFKVARNGDTDPATGQPMKTMKTIEVGNTFSLGTKFSQPFDLTVVNEDGKDIMLIMGCYGIGVSRLVGVIAEHFADDKGLVWPENVAPFKAYLAPIGTSDVVMKQAEKLYSVLTAAGISILYDNRNIRPGEKFADADLVGVPHRIVISDKTVATGTYEYKARASDAVKQLSEAELHRLLSA